MEKRRGNKVHYFIRKTKYFILLVLFIILISVSVSGQKINPDGYNKFYYPNGQISSEGNMKNGKPDGYWKTYYVTGILKSEGLRVNHELDSLWVFYNQLGDTIEKINYKYGKKNGFDFRYGYDVKKNATYKGYISSRELYLNDKKEGTTYYYYSNKAIKRKENYVNGKLQGLAYEYLENGEINTLLEYNNGYLINREKINRKDKNNLKQGIWKEFYKNGKIHIEKNFLDDKLNGYYKEYDERGNLKLTLQYIDNKIVKDNVSETDQIEIRNKYDSSGILIESGAYLKNIPVGIQRKYSKEGNVISAQVNNNEGKIISKGIIDEKGIKKGPWIDFYENGSKKDQGNYSENKRKGTWTFYDKKNKIEQDGNYRNGRINGTWKWYYPSGNLLRVENYFNGKEDGPTIEYSDSGKILIKGEYISGEKENEWLYQIGDITQRGSYITGLKEGLWKSYFKDNTLQYEGNYVKGLADGKHKYYFPNGAIKEEQYYVMGSKEKVWKKYNQEGNIIITISYKNDIEKRINGVKVNLVPDVKRIK